MWTILLPILIPFTAALLLFARRDNNRYQKSVSLTAAIATFISSFHLLCHVYRHGIQVLHMGNWKAPFGIVFAVDMLGAIMVAISAVVGLTTLLYAFHDIRPTRMKGYFYALFFFLIFGINGSFMTGDLFNLFVFFEVLLLASYVMLVLGNEHKQASAGFTYLVLNLIGSTLFLTAAGILFGLVGTLNMADIANRIGSVENKGLVTVVAMLFFIVFGLKSAMFPINNWLPDAYTAPPTPVSAIFAGLLTKVGVYSMYRVFGTIFSHDVSFTHHTILIPLAGLTMIIGVWGAMVQYDIRSILAYHSISQVGYILMGLSIFTPLALAGGIFHMIHHSLVKSSLFLIGGGVGTAAGSQDLKKIGGLVSKFAGLATLFMISAMALAGIPPLSGFFSKFALVVSGLVAKHPILVISALATSLFTLYSMIKIWRLGFWGVFKSAPGASTEPTGTKWNYIFSSAVSVIFVILMTLCARPLMEMCQKAGDQLLDRKAYIQKVLSSQPVFYQSRS